MDNEKNNPPPWDYQGVLNILPSVPVPVMPAEKKKAFAETLPPSRTNRRRKTFVEELIDLLGDPADESIILLPPHMRLAAYISFLRTKEEESVKAGQGSWASLIRLKFSSLSKILSHVKTEEEIAHDRDIPAHIKQLLVESGTISGLLLKAATGKGEIVFSPHYSSDEESAQRARKMPHKHGPFRATPACQHFAVFAAEAFTTSRQYLKGSFEREFFEARTNILDHCLHVLAHETFLDPDVILVENRIEGARIIIEPRWMIYIFTS